MTFSTPEREWLRQAARVEPDWPAMTRIARTALDYGQLRHMALLHQLDGVVAWRLLDERMDGVVPNIVRDDCRQYLDWLNGVPRQHFADCLRPALAALDGAGITWVSTSGPIQYAPLGMFATAWPREWNDFDVLVPSAQYLEACRVLESVDGYHFAGKHGGDCEPIYRADGGFEITLMGVPDDAHDPNAETRPFYDSPGLYADRLPIAVDDLTFWAPRPEWAVAVMAFRTFVGYGNQAQPLPLWGLARLRNWREFAAEWVEDELATAIRNAAQVHYDLTPTYPSLNWGRHILWTLEMASRVYGVPFPDGFDDLLKSPLYIPSAGGRVLVGDRRELLSAYEVAADDDEALLFDASRQNLDQRMSGGHWREAEASEQRREQRREHVG